LAAPTEKRTRIALDEVRRLKLDISATFIRDTFSMRSADLEIMLDGLRKAGLEG
jgi:hypothetical protein